MPKVARPHFLLDPSSSTKIVYACMLYEKGRFAYNSCVEPTYLTFLNAGSKSSQYQVQWYSSRAEVYMENRRPSWTL
jgi:hypothetical protein